MSDGTRTDPWMLTTPSGGAQFTAFRDETLDPPATGSRLGEPTS